MYCEIIRLLCNRQSQSIPATTHTSGLPAMLSQLSVNIRDMHRNRNIGKEGLAKSG